ncbi:hypothetical protein [Paenibacillus sp. FSL R10-2736]|uniref:hypothetical protein n=1 Tax=Paenibacillus sp. FSL R10-2736 TaxID=2954692 RepID=UPI0030F6639A
MQNKRAWPLARPLKSGQLRWSNKYPLMLEVFLRNTILKPMSLSCRQAKAVLSNPLVLKLGKQGSAFPITRLAVILRADPGTNGFRLQLINTKSG